MSYEADGDSTRRMRMRLYLLPLAIAACQANPYSNVPDAKLHAQAMSLALPERYDFYVRVLHSRVPRRPIIADDIAALGRPAWKYVVARASSGGPAELSQALPVLFAFKHRCSQEKLDQLTGHADHVAYAEQEEALKSSIETLCGANLPAGD